MSMIAVVAVVAIGATGAFFSDTETSTGNTFTAGAIDLKVDSEQHYNGQICTLYTGTTDLVRTNGQYYWEGNGSYPVAGTPCDGTWTEADLGAQKFFNFGDVKPGDEGENTISLHVINNDAYACVDVNVTDNDDNGLTEPEGLVDVTGGAGQGELAQGINFFAWSDAGADGQQGTEDTGEGDNVWQYPAELPLFSNIVGPASDVLTSRTYVLAQGPGAPITGGQTQYIGLSWCAGWLDATTTPGTLTCNGAGMGNNTQTDSFKANVTFRVEQARNNSGFRCTPVL